MRTKEYRSAAITGAGGGLGRDIALGLTTKGYQVFGTAMAAGEIADLRQASAGKASLQVCDITDETSVQQWVRSVSHVLGESGLDLLVSNAGILTPGPLEILPLAAVKHEFEVNVFGSLAVINAFLPALRQARGRIVQIGAMTGRFPIPFNGPSSASKATLEAFADIYRAELKPFGVDFVIAQAGNLLTGGPAKTAAALQRVADSMTPAQRELYGHAFDKFAAALNKMQGSGQPSVDAAKRVIELAEQTPAPSRAPVGADARKSSNWCAKNPTPSWTRSGWKLSASTKNTLHPQGLAMIELVNRNDQPAMRNKDIVLRLYEMMINQKKSEEAAARYISPAYLQHNPLIGDGPAALGKFFGKVTAERARARVVVHKIIAVDDYVFAHVNFLNLFNDDPNDPGVAGVDIYKMDADGKAIEHWDALQFVGDPKNSAPWLMPNVPSANSNGMF